jgi:hypothetical protein
MTLLHISIPYSPLPGAYASILKEADLKSRVQKFSTSEDKNLKATAKNLMDALK